MAHMKRRRAMSKFLSFSLIALVAACVIFRCDLAIHYRFCVVFINRLLFRLELRGAVRGAFGY
jgi:hypothetical protein